MQNLKKTIAVHNKRWGHRPDRVHIVNPSASIVSAQNLMSNLGMTCMVDGVVITVEITNMAGSRR
jgi:hypothetical protein